MARITKDPAIRKAEILDTAEALFQEKGYLGTAVSDIVRQVGVSQGTFYYYFKSKEEIIEEIIKRQIEQVTNSINKIVEDRVLTPPEKIVRSIQAVFQITCYVQEKFRNFAMDDHVNLIGKLSDHGKKAVFPYFLKIIEEGQRENLFLTAQPEISLEFIMGMHACLMRSGFERLPDDIMNAKFAMAAKLMGYALGAPEDTIRLSYTQMLR